MFTERLQLTLSLQPSHKDTISDEALQCFRPSDPVVLVKCSHEVSTIDAFEQCIASSIA